MENVTTYRNVIKRLFREFSRLEQLLQKLEVPRPGETIQALRAIEVLEHAGTTEARQFLQSLAKGAPAALLTREAKASLKRLASQPAVQP
ncbi:MAG TPA: hypothetical protein VG099_17300 [Gemmataceae bacterium]|jgi:hypothetical protein|nr:hypothetical protein [Gemmataceae bacterium]